jgi:hypothetical protein
MGRVQREWCPGVHPLHRETRNLAGEPQEQKKARERLVAFLRFVVGAVCSTNGLTVDTPRETETLRDDVWCVCECICLDVCE